MKSDSFLTGIREYWPIIVFIGSLILGWASLDARVQELEKTSIEHTTQIKVALDGVNGIREQLAEIKTTLLFIKEEVTKSQ